MYRCVNKKTTRKGTFFELGRKNAILVGKRCVFTNLTNGCRSKRVCVLIYYIGKGYFLSGHNEEVL